MEDAINANMLKRYPMRFAIITIMVLIHAALQFGVYMPAAIGPVLMTEYGFDPVGFSMVVSMPYLAGFVLGIFSGALADKKSVRFVMIGGLAIAAVGAVMRAVFISFVPMLIASFLLGVALAALNANSTKLCSMWFPGKSASSAMGVYIFGATIGTSVCMSVGPMIGDAPTVLWIAGILIVIAFVLWVVLGKTHPAEKLNIEENKDESMTKDLSIVIKNKNIWIVSIFMFCAFGGVVAQNSFSNVALLELTGDAVVAGNVSSINALAVGLGGIIMPMIISRMKSLKPILFASTILNAIWLYLILACPFGVVTWVLVITQGIWVGTILAYGKTLPALLPGMKLSLLGAAGGMQSMFQNLGAFLVPAYIITPICAASFGASPISIYVGAGIFFVVGGLIILLLPKIGTVVETQDEL